MKKPTDKSFLYRLDLASNLLQYFYSNNQNSSKVFEKLIFFTMQAKCGFMIDSLCPFVFTFY